MQFNNKLGVEDVEKKISLGRDDRQRWLTESHELDDLGLNDEEEIVLKNAGIFRISDLIRQSHNTLRTILEATFPNKWKIYINEIKESLAVRGLSLTG